MNCGDILLLLLALILPPIPVLIKVGCAGHFWLNVLLTILGYLPGVIHAWWLIITRSEPAEVHYHVYT
jgi:uncharacterized membrane protein YqaE (UPF0057 family)